MRILVFDAQSYKFCLFIHTFIHNKLGIIKKGGICFQSAAFFLRVILLVYQIDTRFSTGKNIGSFSVTLNASYQAPICGNAPFTRHSPNECTSLFVRFSTSSGRISLAHTPAYARKKRCSGVRPSSTGSGLAAVAS